MFAAPVQAALAATSYAKRTITAVRNQKSFEYSLVKFIQVREFG